jgi:mono/diheme cytochrome c family protein
MSMNKPSISRIITICSMLIAVGLLSTGCRYDMQDQPRLKSYKQSDFFSNQMGSRTPVAGTIARGYLREDNALYTGKKDVLSTEAPQTMTDADGNVRVTTFPNDIDYFPVPVTKELLDRGQARFKIYCAVCHGPLGMGDGMIVRRGFSKPPSYHDDRLRNAPVGHFFDVATNGSGKMNGYASQVPVADRWAIVSYIRALQISQNPNGMQPLPMTDQTSNTNNAQGEMKTGSNPDRSKPSVSDSKASSRQPTTNGGNH